MTLETKKNSHINCVTIIIKIKIICVQYWQLCIVHVIALYASF